MFGQQQQGGGLGVGGVVNLIYVLVSGHATCLTPFVRRNFGSEALGRNGAVAMLIIVFYMAAYPRHVAVGQFGTLWFAMLILQRLKTGWLMRKGTVLHSYDDGYPVLGFIIPQVKRFETAYIIEFFVVIGFGIWLSNYDAALSRLVVVSSVCMVIKTAIEQDIARKRLRAMRDAEIEQRAMLDRYRRGDF
jgi:hypothetical protein